MKNEYKRIPKTIAQSRSRTKKIIEDYLKHRSPKLYVGEFLDDQGCQLPQFGLGGTGFLLALRKKHGIDGEALIAAEKLLNEGIEKDEQDRSKDEQRLLKDILRVPSKAVLLSLCLEKKKPITDILKNVLVHGLADDLIKPVMDYESVRGNVFVSCYFLQLIYLSDIQISKSLDKQKDKILSQLEKELREKDIGIDRKLYISTTLCMYDFDKHIPYHREMLSELYAKNNDWIKSFSVSTPFRGGSSFLDVWFPDGKKDDQNNRYLRIPLGFIALSSIYMALGSEKAFFNFKPVQELVQHLTTSIDGENQNERPRKTAYYLFFMYIMLHPKKYFDSPDTGFFRHVQNRLSFSWNNLTRIGVLVLLLICFGCARAAFFTLELYQAFPDPDISKNLLQGVITNLALATIGVLSLMRTIKK